MEERIGFYSAVCSVAPLSLLFPFSPPLVQAVLRDDTLIKERKKKKATRQRKLKANERPKMKAVNTPEMAKKKTKKEKEQEIFGRADLARVQKVRQSFLFVFLLVFGVLFLPAFIVFLLYLVL